jgi:hypothetical protein
MLTIRNLDLAAIFGQIRLCGFISTHGWQNLAENVPGKASSKQHGAQVKSGNWSRLSRS